MTKPNRVEFMQRIGAYGVKKSAQGGWTVYRSDTGEVILTNIPTRLRARYKAAVCMGLVTNVFMFGDL